MRIMVTTEKATMVKWQGSLHTLWLENSNSTSFDSSSGLTYQHYNRFKNDIPDKMLIQERSNGPCYTR